MTILVNDPHSFADESLAAFAQAHPGSVQLVDGGIVRAAAGPATRVAIVSGGGSGHFPAFAGWVGDGLLEGAACGAIFSSPSQRQIVTVARSADNGAGVLFVPINYAGDILHFGAAAEELRHAGIDARMVAITDDIASGSAAEPNTRRGIAGSFPIVKILGAAAAAGSTLDELERLAIRSNEATRSFGVAFSGCTLPGSDHPLFEVPPGRMAVGLGIHGEPGISEAPIGTADEVTDLVIDGLFEERSPERGRAVAVLVNGLGTTKYDELNLVLARTIRRLDDAGMVAVAPVVGELVTSLDMAGLSISLTYLDDETEAFWLASASSPAFTRREFEPAAPLRTVWHDEADVAIERGSAGSHSAAARILSGFERAHEALRREEEALGALDAVAGDGDHGVGMVRGVSGALDAARAAVAAGAGASTTLRMAGEKWSDASGGTSGALWGDGLVAAASALDDDRSPTGDDIVGAVRRFADAVAGRGGAAVGDKTMIDAIAPFASELERNHGRGLNLADAWSAAAKSAAEGATLTAGFASHLGRSRLHGSRSVGYADPGATSFALIVLTLDPLDAT